MDTKEFIWDFSIELLKKAYQGENLLISPISVLAALDVLYHGTAGTTRQQIEDVLHVDTEELEMYLESIFGTSEQGTDERINVGFSNAICITKRDDISICESFKEEVSKNNFTEFFELPKEEIKDTLNAWSTKKTNGMIPEIVENVSDRSILHVLNAVSFEAEWHDKFGLSKTKKGLFVNEKGIEEEVDFMVHDDECFLSDKGYDGTIYATGFVKPYMNKRYAFVALLPGEGMTLQEYINTLEGERLDFNLRCFNGQTVVIRVPRLKIKCQTDMKEVINNLGITEVFNEKKLIFQIFLLIKRIQRVFWLINLFKKHVLN